MNNTYRLRDEFGIEFDYYGRSAEDAIALALEYRGVHCVVLYVVAQRNELV